MKQIIMEEPIYEKVQTGTSKTEKWQTYDGEVFNQKVDAEDHEFFNLKLKQRPVFIEELQQAEVVDLACEEDLIKYADELAWNADPKYDPSELIYPGTYVFFVLDEGERNERYAVSNWSAYCLPLNDYKELVISKLKLIS